MQDVKIYKIMDIKKEASEYVKTPPLKAALNLFDKEDIESHIEVAFRNGAQYALEHQWISVKDKLPYMFKDLMSENKKLPCTKSVLTIDKRGRLYVDLMYRYLDCWEWRLLQIDNSQDDWSAEYWMPIPKLNNKL